MHFKWTVEGLVDCFRKTARDTTWRNPAQGPKKQVRLWYFREEATGANPSIGRKLWVEGNPTAQTKQMHIISTWKYCRYSILPRTITRQTYIKQNILYLVGGFNPKILYSQNGNLPQVVYNTLNFWRFQVVKVDHHDPSPKLKIPKCPLHSHHHPLDGLQGQPSWASADSCCECCLKPKAPKNEWMSSGKQNKHQRVGKHVILAPYTAYLIATMSPNVFLETKWRYLNGLHKKQDAVGETHLDIVDILCVRNYRPRLWQGVGATWAVGENLALEFVELKSSKPGPKLELKCESENNLQPQWNWDGPFHTCMTRIVYRNMVSFFLGKVSKTMICKQYMHYKYLLPVISLVFFSCMKVIQR